MQLVTSSACMHADSCLHMNKQLNIWQVRHAGVQHPSSFTFSTAVAYAFLMHANTRLSWSADSDGHKHEQARNQAHLYNFSQLAATSANALKA